MKRLAPRALSPLLLLFTALALAVPPAPARQDATKQDAAKQDAKKDAPLVVALGNRSVTIPAPTGHEEGAAQFPLLKELFARAEPQGNNLLAVFLPADVAATMRANGGKFEGLRVFHAKVAVDKQFREADCSPADFAQFVAAVRAQVPQMVRANSPLMRRRLKELEKMHGELGTGVTKYGISETEQLGELELGPNVYSTMFFMRLQVEVNGEKSSQPRLVTGSVVRVNRRLLYVYTYRIFKSDADADALEQFTRDWVRQIVAANPAD